MTTLFNAAKKFINLYGGISDSEEEAYTDEQKEACANEEEEKDQDTSSDYVPSTSSNDSSSVSSEDKYVTLETMKKQIDDLRSELLDLLDANKMTAKGISKDKINVTYNATKSKKKSQSRKKNKRPWRSSDEETNSIDDFIVDDEDSQEEDYETNSSFTPAIPMNRLSDLNTRSSNSNNCLRKKSQYNNFDFNT